MRSTQVHIDTPCHESWEAMDGGAERRFCGVCQKDVHNLSAMRLDDARALLRESQGSNLCVRYSAESDGTLRFRDLVPTARLTRGLVRGVFAAALLAACSPTVDITVAGLGETVLESIRGSTTPTPDGGCDYTTGPFTTFHLAPGHVLCRSNGHDALALPPALIATPTDPNISTNIPPSIPQIVVAQPVPIEPPMMGQAIAIPEPIEPFVPCDPKPIHAPPPKLPPPTPTYERMGDIAPPPQAMGGIAVREPPPIEPVREPIEPGFAPPPSGDSPPPPPRPGFAPPPPPRPGYAPPPQDPVDAPLMGSISPASVAPEKMGRVAPSRR